MAEAGRGELRPLERPVLREAARPKLAAQVARQIVDYIDEHGIGPGGTLPPERVMLPALRVSRVTLREALRILEVHGLISIKPGPTGGPVVNAMSGAELAMASSLHFHMAQATFRELWEARLAIEPLMARLAAADRSGTVAQRLRASADRARDAGDDAYLEAVSDFHTVLSSASGNRILDLYALAISEVWNRHVEGRLFPKRERARVYADHDAIAEAVVAGDGDRAERLMREHVEEMKRYVERRFRGVLDETIPFTL